MGVTRKPHATRQIDSKMHKMNEQAELRRAGLLMPALSSLAIRPLRETPPPELGSGSEEAFQPMTEPLDLLTLADTLWRSGKAASFIHGILGVLKKNDKGEVARLTEGRLAALLQDGNCSICLEPLEVGEDVFILPCRHAFTPVCALEWFKLHKECPLCRKKIAAKVDLRNMIKTKINEKKDISGAKRGCLPERLKLLIEILQLICSTHNVLVVCDESFEHFGTSVRGRDQLKIGASVRGRDQLKIGASVWQLDDQDDFEYEETRELLEGPDSIWNASSGMPPGYLKLYSEAVWQVKPLGEGELKKAMERPDKEETNLYEADPKIQRIVAVIEERQERLVKEKKRLALNLEEKEWTTNGSLSFKIDDLMNLNVNRHAKEEYNLKDLRENTDYYNELIFAFCQGLFEILAFHMLPTNVSKEVKFVRGRTIMWHLYSKFGDWVKSAIRRAEKEYKPCAEPELDELAELKALCDYDWTSGFNSEIKAGKKLIQKLANSQHWGTQLRLQYHITGCGEVGKDIFDSEEEEELDKNACRVSFHGYVKWADTSRTKAYPIMTIKPLCAVAPKPLCAVAPRVRTRLTPWDPVPGGLD